jgi:hypothetical protein
MLEMFQADRLNADWLAMRALLHPEARLESLAAPGFVLTADELIEAIQGAMSHGIYSVTSWRLEPLSEHAAIAVGRVRYRVAPAGFTDESRVWLASERDKLIWRMRIFSDRSHATVCLSANGLGLGLAL